MGQTEGPETLTRLAADSAVIEEGQGIVAPEKFRPAKPMHSGAWFSPASDSTKLAQYLMAVRLDVRSLRKASRTSSALDALGASWRYTSNSWRAGANWPEAS